MEKEDADSDADSMSNVDDAEIEEVVHPSALLLGSKHAGVDVCFILIA